MEKLGNRRNAWTQQEINGMVAEQGDIDRKLTAVKQYLHLHQGPFHECPLCGRMHEYSPNRVEAGLPKESKK